MDTSQDIVYPGTLLWPNRRNVRPLPPLRFSHNHQLQYLDVSSQVRFDVGEYVDSCADPDCPSFSRP